MGEGAPGGGDPRGHLEEYLQPLRRDVQPLGDPAPQLGEGGLEGGEGAGPWAERGTHVIGQVDGHLVHHMTDVLGQVDGDGDHLVEGSACCLSGGQ